MIPHLEHADHPDASFANAEKWAARIPAPTYAAFLSHLRGSRNFRIACEWSLTTMTVKTCVLGGTAIPFHAPGLRRATG